MGGEEVCREHLLSGSGDSLAFDNEAEDDSSNNVPDIRYTESVGKRCTHEGCGKWCAGSGQNFCPEHLREYEAEAQARKESHAVLRDGDILFRLQSAKAWVEVNMKISNDGALSLSRKVTTRQRKMSAISEYTYNARFNSKTLGLSFGDINANGVVKVVINYVQTGSEAASQGIQLGDVIAELNGTPVLSTTSLRGVVSVLPRPMVFKLVRDPRKMAGTEKVGSMMTLSKEMLSRAHFTVHSKPKASRHSMVTAGASQGEYYMFEIRIGVRMLQFACASEAEMRGWINGFQGKHEPAVDRLLHSETELAAQFGVVRGRSKSRSKSSASSPPSNLRKMNSPANIELMGVGQGKRGSLRNSRVSRNSLRKSAVARKISARSSMLKASIGVLSAVEDGEGGVGPASLSPGVPNALKTVTSSSKLLRVHGGQTKQVTLGTKGPRRTGVETGVTNRALDTIEGVDEEWEVSRLQVCQLTQIYTNTACCLPLFALGSSPPYISPPGGRDGYACDDACQQVVRQLGRTSARNRRPSRWRWPVACC
jgi:hypothetical protein